ncbi:MAG: hypothetical protein A3E87_05710 [Gammaproteobacteria bacterium RIFCSPHIGHO2_12_FULL_35_23]|nr:MAG: hypothetical protein A3E87_05710 [Gammaproteobacteria bacterium RIFCSPHIGHO2_12_FULL_35_23]
MPQKELPSQQTSKSKDFATIAIIDGEISTAHIKRYCEIFPGKLVNFKPKSFTSCPDDVIGCDFSGQEPQGIDRDKRVDFSRGLSHGTQTATIIACSLGPRTRYYYVDVGLKRETIKWEERLELDYRALKYVASRRPDVVSMAWMTVHKCQDQGEHAYNLIRTDIQKTYAHISEIITGRLNGTLFVSAAGNDGHNIGPTSKKCYAIWPGSMGFSNVLVVGAADHFGNIARISNFGSYVKIALKPLNPEYVSESTSRATALMSAIATNIRAAYPLLTPREIIRALYLTGDIPKNAEERPGPRVLNAGKLLSYLQKRYGDPVVPINIAGAPTKMDELTEFIIQAIKELPVSYYFMLCGAVFWGVFGDAIYETMRDYFIAHKAEQEFNTFSTTAGLLIRSQVPPAITATADIIKGISADGLKGVMTETVNIGIRGWVPNGITIIANSVKSGIGGWWNRSGSFIDGLRSGFWSSIPGNFILKDAEIARNNYRAALQRIRESWLSYNTREGKEVTDEEAYNKWVELCIINKAWRRHCNKEGVVIEKNIWLTMGVAKSETAVVRKDAFIFSFDEVMSESLTISVT